MSTSDFYSGTDWQGSSGPYCNRYFEEADLWPEGAGSEIDGGDKDALAAGLHPVLAIGAKAHRPRNQTGVVVAYESDDKVLLNVAHCAIVKQYVANILTYSGGAANSWSGSIDAGTSVYVDDSGPLASGVTLSLSPTNESGSANPFAGWIIYCQDEYKDSDFGGLHSSASLPVTASTTQTEYDLFCIELTPAGF